MKSCSGEAWTQFRAFDASKYSGFVVVVVVWLFFYTISLGWISQFHEIQFKAIFLITE